LFQERKDSKRSLANGSGTKQSKTANGMLVVLRNVLAPTFNELLQWALHESSAMEFPVLVPKSDGFIIE
jgi:hypothetical protein